MNCQNCDAPVLVSDERCEKCGAKLLHRRVFLGAAKTEDFTLTGDEPASDFDDALAEEDFEPLFQARIGASPTCCRDRQHDAARSRATADSGAASAPLLSISR